MAKITSSGQIKGTVGPVSYRSINGQAIVQSRPGTIKQSKATKASGFDFGRASRTSKAIRTALFPVLRDFEDSAFYRRFTGLVTKATLAANSGISGRRILKDGDLSLLANTDCNNSSPFSRYCLVEVHGGIENHRMSLSLPAFDIKQQLVQLPNATHATLCYLVVAINPETLAETHAEMFELPLSFTAVSTEAVAWLTGPLPENQLLVIASAIFYFRKNKLAGMIGQNSRDFHPCEITAVLLT
ncbi:hypothetical protein FNO01nite_14120 [Flavobacterium noncentrifugens]|uniref:Uncharacterized protein n=1 Tax=Flavobacterium noncentrifugens TaxID=1128970 RepID=A0A1G8W2H0_9FLAO|nr:hypothetical protein [Flavobacterium noncentrifugens]GEP50740.1 hypothetical protein FNO01nite_14120 [Flavobacterium noncentrifugens]SDJ72286.1 hypothetical protein SAMN04487935_1616 [Flavobacterium noncentrifugens]